MFGFTKGSYLTDIAQLERLIGSAVKGLGYDLVRVQMIGGTSDPTLQVMAEKPDTRQLGIADCEVISRRLSEILDTTDPIEGSYRLEVSSPGIDRPLTRLTDFSDWSGHEARIALVEPLEARKSFSGTLQGIEGDRILILVKDGNTYSLPFAQIASAKLLLTDKLINATAPLSTEGADTIQMQEEEL
jgi:ribosome maturation factor RimP